MSSPLVGASGRLRDQRPSLLAHRTPRSCICRDHCSEDICYYGDVNAAMDYGFDSIKLDGCGAEMDLYKYAALLERTGKAYLIGWWRRDGTAAVGCWG